MRLFHGSNIEVAEVDLGRCRPYKDFGRGFYLTDIREQAAQMAARVARIYGGSPFVSAFGFDEAAASAGARMLRFDRPTRDWAVFVMNNRDRHHACVDDALCNQDGKYDIVAGPVANDDIAFLFRTFARGLIDVDTLAAGLEYKTLTNQYSFHTEKALAYLHAERR